MLKERFPSFILLLSIAAALVFVPKEYGIFLFALVGVYAFYLSARELSGLFEKMNLPSAYALMASLINVIFLVLIFSFYKGQSSELYTVILAIIVTVSILLLPWKLFLNCRISQENIRIVLGTFSGLFLLLPFLMLVPLYFITPVSALGTPSWIACPLLVYLILVTKIGGDTGAYIFGSLSNKFITKGKNHKISPNISPNKSWEGTLAGMCCAMAISFFIGPYLLPYNLAHPIVLLVLGLILFWGGFFGDLTESALKRAANVKDSGKFLPGTGGVLDVLDSLVFNATLLLVIILLSSLYFHHA